jgi:uncharacterized protein YkwD
MIRRSRPEILLRVCGPGASGPRALLLALLAVLAALVLAAGAPAGRTTPERGLQVSLLARVNELRRARGLQPVRLDPRLTAAALAHSQQMAAQGYFDHASSNGTPFWRRIAQYYPPRPRAIWVVGENLLWVTGSASAGAALRSWMNSPPHRQILLRRDWLDVGLAAVHAGAAPGVYGSGNVTIITADFGRR